MFSFRQKIFISYALVFLVFLLMLFPFVVSWVGYLVHKTMDDRTTEIIINIKDAPNNDLLVKNLKNQKSLMFFRSSVISNERRLLYDSHTKRILGVQFDPNHIVDYPEVMQAFREGKGYHEDYSHILNQKFSYFAKAFDFNGQTYVLRTAFPWQYVTDISRDVEIGLSGILITILLTFSLLTWFVINYLTKPIQRIIQAVRPYQQGIVDVLPAINLNNLNPKDDFAKLAFTLDSLSARIQSHINTITAERNEKKAILESLGEGVIAVDHQMLIAYINHMANRFINLQDCHLIGENFSILQQDRCEKLLKACQEQHKPLTDTLELVIDNKRVHLDLIAAPKKNDEGAILVLQDKTAHHKIFEMRRDFIANASHELKTPITVIRGYAEALHDNPGLSEEIKTQMTSKIIRSCNRMTSLIKDFLTLADIENIPSSRLVKCDLHNLFQHCISMLLEAYPLTHLQLHSLTQPIYLIADEGLLELAMMNLIENAAKYSTSPAYIEITLEEKNDTTKIQISDRGIGIPLLDQEHIFDRFYTVDKAHSQKMGGSGLGLSIVKTIIEKHFGTISVQSELGKGTTFTIYLPKIEEEAEHKD